MQYVRKQSKGFGRGAQIEGDFDEGARILLVEDLTTDGQSKLKFCQALRDAGAVVSHTFVIFHYDIFPQTKEAFKSHNLEMLSLATWWDVLAVSKEFGHFVNDRRLSDEEKNLIYRWVESGAPRGDVTKLPVAKKYTPGWQLPKKPDLVLPIAKRPYRVPAEGVVRYQYFRVDPGFKEDKWIQAAEILPGNRAVVHHILAFARLPGERLWPAPLGQCWSGAHACVLV